MEKTPSFPPYKPPVLSRFQALLLNAILLRSSPWIVPFGTGELHITPLPDPASFSPACAVLLEIGGTSWRLELDDTALLLRHEVFFPSQEEAIPLPEERNLPAEVRRALLEALSSPFLAELKKSLNTSFTIQDVDFAPHEEKASCCAAFKAFIPAHDGLAELTALVRLIPLNPEDSSFLAHALQNLPIRSTGPMENTVKTIPLELALESGYLFLQRKEVSLLSREDILLPEVWTMPEKLTLRIQRSNAAPLMAVCTISGGTAAISSPLSEEPEPSMDTPETKDLDVRLSFELDRRIITVGELEALSQGYTFSMNSLGDSSVTIRANGKAIAMGRMVDMGGTLGVQISEIL